MIAMKVFITGGCGLIGSTTAEYYASKGHKVIVFDNLERQRLAKTGWRSEKIQKYNWIYLSQFTNIELVEGDIREKSKMLEAAKNCDYIIHAAAQTAMTDSIEDPEADFYINALGTFNTLEVARYYRVPIVYCSTNQVYGDVASKLVVEDETRFRAVKTPLIDESYPIGSGTLAPYGCSKLAADLYVQNYARIYPLRTAVFRLSSIYGPRQFAHEGQGWVAHLVIKGMLDQPITIFGTGKQTRDVLFAPDLARAFDCFYQRGHNGVYNVGGGEDNTISVLELLEVIRQMTGKKLKLRSDKERVGDKKYFVSDISKAKRELGWEPKISREEGISMLIEWVKKNKSIFRKS